MHKWFECGLGTYWSKLEELLMFKEIISRTAFINIKNLKFR